MCVYLRWSIYHVSLEEFIVNGCFRASYNIVTQKPWKTSNKKYAKKLLTTSVLLSQFVPNYNNLLRQARQKLPQYKNTKKTPQRNPYNFSWNSSIHDWLSKFRKLKQLFRADPTPHPSPASWLPNIAKYCSSIPGK